MRPWHPWSCKMSAKRSALGFSRPTDNFCSVAWRESTVWWMPAIVPTTRSKLAGKSPSRCATRARSSVEQCSTPRPQVCPCSGSVGGAAAQAAGIVRPVMERVYSSSKPCNFETVAESAAFVVGPEPTESACTVRFPSCTCFTYEELMSYCGRYCVNQMPQGPDPIARDR